MAGKLNKSQTYTIFWQWKEEVEDGTLLVKVEEQQATNAERAISKLRRELAESYDDLGKADVVIFGVQRGSLGIEGLNDEE